MKFCRYKSNDSIGLGILEGNAITPIREIDDSLPGDINELMCVDRLIERVSNRPANTATINSDYRILSPIRRPGKVICIGLNYRDHALETGSEIPDEPIVFCKFPSTVIGHGDPIILPAASSDVDYEAELVVVIGKCGYNISVDEAMDYVFGYACGHDVSARDWQKGTPGGQWLLGKAFDTFAPLGPAIVHKSAIPDPGNLSIQMRVGGETLQDGSTRELIFGIPELIAHLSKVFTLEPGDVIFTGTPPGVGAARNPKRFLKPGETCEVAIEGIGTLANSCVAWDSQEAKQFRNAGFAE